MDSMNDADALACGLAQYNNRGICTKGAECPNLGTEWRCKYRHLRNHLPAHASAKWVAEVFTPHMCARGRSCARYRQGTCGDVHPWSDYLALPMQAGVSARAWLEAKNPAAAFLTDAYEPVAEQQAQDVKAVAGERRRRRRHQKRAAQAAVAERAVVPYTGGAAAGRG